MKNLHSVPDIFGVFTRFGQCQNLKHNIGVQGPGFVIRYPDGNNDWERCPLS